MLKKTRKGHDYGYPHAFGASARKRRSSEKEREQSGASASNAFGWEPASTTERPASAMTAAEKCENSPQQRLVIAESPTQSQEAGNAKKSTRARSRARQRRRQPRSHQSQCPSERHCHFIAQMNNASHCKGTKIWPVKMYLKMYLGILNVSKNVSRIKPFWFNS